MNKANLTLALLILFFWNINAKETTPSAYLTWSSQNQTISGDAGQYLTAIITVQCHGDVSEYRSYSITPCQVDDGYIETDFANRNLYGGEIALIRFKFKKPTSLVASTYTYKFKKNFSDNCNDDLISITVNYNPSTCTIIPQNFQASASPNSLVISWSNNYNASEYWLTYNVVGSIGGSSKIVYSTECNSNICSCTINGLLPSTTYDLKLKAKCVGSTFGEEIVIQKNTNICSTNVPTNLNATTWSGSGYYISFTPVTGTSAYGFEYVDLVTNNTGTSTIFYSSSANEGNNTDYTIPSGHSFKFRLIVPCSGAASEWKTINVAPLCELASPSNPALVNYCSYGTGGQCGYGRFTWNAVSGANNYEVQYTIYNLAGQVTSGTFQTTLTNFVQMGMYGSGSGPWYVKFRVRSRCSSTNTWGQFGSEITVPW